ncbi:hypothetical protein J4402_01355 [Candidatus Pacearchaeota archaeon]|nr:hypothetical protein [Candidatus Pacearchaeota archaeon]
MISFILACSDDPLKQITECLDVTGRIEKECEKNSKITLDLSRLEWILPCSALILSNKISEVAGKGCAITFIKPEKPQVKNYLESVGFPLGGVGTNATYMPIHHFSRKKGEDSTKIIEKEMEEIYSVVEKNLPSELSSGIYYLLGELSDNIDQHSNFTIVSIMVQYYKKKGHIDIGVLDNGETIPGVFEKNGIKFERDEEAIKMALQGISTKEGEIGRGKGLITSKRLVQKGLNGEFFILSRKGFVKAVGEKTIFNELGGRSFKGTLIYMRFSDPRKGLNIYKYVE